MNNQKYGDRKLRFPHVKEFFGNLLAFWTYDSPVLGRKNLEYQF
jgi:hypothetical protein